MQYIHKDCILRWATIDGHINATRLVCSICTERYTIDMVNLESFFTGVYVVDLVLYNPTWVSLAINYLSLFYGIYEGNMSRQPLYIAQVITYLLYAVLVCLYVRIQNVEMYADAIIERRAYLYWIIQVYSSYNAYIKNYEIMAITAVLAHNLIWREHIAALRHVNRALLGVHAE
jgi:hypothetical protein